MKDVSQECFNRHIIEEISDIKEALKELQEALDELKSDQDAVVAALTEGTGTIPKSINLNEVTELWLPRPQSIVDIIILNNDINDVVGVEVGGETIYGHTYAPNIHSIIIKLEETQLIYRVMKPNVHVLKLTRSLKELIGTEIEQVRVYTKDYDRILLITPRNHPIAITEVDDQMAYARLAEENKI